MVGKVVYFTDTPEGKERIWTFRVIENKDEKNKLLPEIQVEIRGKHMKGQITDEDIISLNEKFKSGKIFNPKRVLNMTTSVEVGQR